MSYKTFPEIIADITAAPDHESQIAKLRSYYSVPLKTAMQYIYWPGFEFFTAEKPKYRADVGPLGLSPNSLAAEIRRFYLFDKKKDLPHEKKLTILTDILESIHPTEAEFICDHILKRSLDAPFSYDFVREAFPTMLPEVKNDADLQDTPKS